MDPQIENRKSSWSTTTPPTLDEKKTVNFGLQTKKLLTFILTHPSGHFSGDYISALRGCYALKFLHALEIDQGYLAHTPTGLGVPPKKNFNRENLKFGLKFSVCTSITSGLMGTSSQIFIQTTCREPGVITWVRDFWQLSTLIANISETDPQIENRKSSWSTTSPPTLDEKRPWTLVHKRKSYWRAYCPTQVAIFRETTFWPLGGAASWNFYSR